MKSTPVVETGEKIWKFSRETALSLFFAVLMLVIAAGIFTAFAVLSFLPAWAAAAAFTTELVHSGSLGMIVAASLASVMTVVWLGEEIKNDSIDKIVKAA